MIVFVFVSTHLYIVWTGILHKVSKKLTTFTKLGTRTWVVLSAHIFCKIKHYLTGTPVSPCCQLFCTYITCFVTDIEHLFYLFNFILFNFLPFSKFLLIGSWNQILIVKRYVGPLEKIFMCLMKEWTAIIKCYVTILGRVRWWLKLHLFEKLKLETH